MAIGSRARAAGRKIAGGLAGTGLAAAGGGVYFGAQTLLTPSIYGGDQSNISKRAWMLPVIGVIGGHVLSRTKVGAVGLGMVGGAVALGIEQIQLGMAMKANAALAPAATTSNTGALLGPGGSPYELPMGADRGFDTSDSGALYASNLSL